jgi:hypothetical protein
MHLKFPQLYTKLNNINRGYIPDLVFEIFCAMWTSEETNSLEFQRSTCIRFELHNLRVVQFCQRRPRVRRFEYKISGEFKTRAVNRRAFKTYTTHLATMLSLL